MENPYFLILVGIILILAEGFFSGSEIAMIACDKKRLRLAMKRGSWRSRLALELLKKPERFLTTTIFGTYLCLISISVLFTAYITKIVGGEGDIYAILLLTPILLIFAEILPKSFFLHNADKIVPAIIVPLYSVSSIFYPLSLAISKAIESIFFLGKIKVESVTTTKEELKIIFRLFQKNIDLGTQEASMIARIFDFSKTHVKEIMIPLIDVSGISDELTCQEAIDIIKRDKYSRYPLYHEGINDITGIINSFDLIGVEDLSLSIREISVPCLYIPESKPIDDLLADLNTRRENMAVVVDEYGGAVGIATVEDILEEIVGEIEDEHDIKDKPFKKLGKDTYLFNARFEIDKFNEMFEPHIPKGEYETLGGFILERLGRIPKVGEMIQSENLILSVEKADKRSVKEIKVRRV